MDFAKTPGTATELPDALRAGADYKLRPRSLLEKLESKAAGVVLRDAVAHKSAAVSRQCAICEAAAKGS
jgi:hypothetical protein